MFATYGRLIYQIMTRQEIWADTILIFQPDFLKAYYTKCQLFFIQFW